MKKETYLESIKKIATENNKAIAKREEDKRSLEEEIIKASALMNEAISSGSQEKHIEAEHKLSFLEDRRRALEAQEVSINLTEGLKLYEGINTEYVKEKDSLINDMEKIIRSMFAKLEELEALESNHFDILAALVEIIPTEKKNEINNSYMLWELPKLRKFMESFIVNTSNVPTSKTLSGWLELFKG